MSSGGIPSWGNGGMPSGGIPVFANGGAGPMDTGGAGPVFGSGGESAGGAFGSTGGIPNTGDGGAGPGGGSSTGGSGGEVPPHGACLDGITNYGSAGPFQYTQKTVGRIKYWVPAVPAGCKVPVVHMANGTTATCSAYAASIQRLASHGFLAACYEDPNTGAGTQGLEALDTALSSFPELADHKFGSTGHSQGGQAAFTVLALAEKKYGFTDWVYAALAMEPASGFGSQPVGATWQQLYSAIQSPVFMFSGLGTDGLVSQSWVQSAYNATSPTVEAYFWTAQGATHIPVPNGLEQEISIPWFRWKLLGDSQACEYFKGIPQRNNIWDEVASKNVKPCQ